jgi:hypothetical protein
MKSVFGREGIAPCRRNLDLSGLDDFSAGLLICQSCESLPDEAEQHPAREAAG